MGNHPGTQRLQTINSDAEIGATLRVAPSLTWLANWCGFLWCPTQFQRGVFGACISLWRLICSCSVLFQQQLLGWLRDENAEHVTVGSASVSGTYRVCWCAHNYQGCNQDAHFALGGPSCDGSLFSVQKQIEPFQGATEKSWFRVTI